MSYFADMIGEITMGIANVAGICRYHEEPDGMDPVCYYDFLVNEAEGQGRAARDALKRIFTAHIDAGLGWVDGQTEVCQRVVDEMLEVGMVDDPDWVLQLVCEVHD